jgi:23S rRNA (uracil1939-C5)-methyltransferase
LLGLRLPLSLPSFFQVNSRQAPVLFQRALAFLGGAGGPVVDAYAGVGALALALAARGCESYAIEVEEQAVADARAAAAHNRISGVHVLAGKVEEELPRLLRQGLRPAGVVLDPPRRGCGPAVIEALLRSPVPRVAYLSCHPGTLARDLKALLQGGFRPTQLEAVDMFPHTAHLEVFAGLERT